MVGLGWAEILVVAILAGGQTTTDVVTLIQPQQYFQARQIEVSVDKMMDLASADPKDAKTQIMQLTALRYLTSESEELKKSPKYAAHRQLLEQIAQGQKAQDTLGFAKEYAGGMLAKLDGVKGKPGKAPVLREDAIAWFPADTTFAAAFDVRLARKQGVANDSVNQLLRLIPERERKEMYEFFEKTGNVRLDRVAFGMADHKDRGKKKLMVRLTGKGNAEWLVETFRNMPFSKFESKQIKDAAGTPIIILSSGNDFGPQMAFVGNTEMIVAGYDGKGTHAEVLQTVLDVRAKKQPNMTTGNMKALLGKIPAQAIAMVVGEVPEDMKREFRFLEAPPQTVFGYIARTPQGMDVIAELAMANAADAGRLVNKIGMLRKDGIEELKKAQQQPPQPGMPPIPFASLIDLLDSLQVNNEAEKVQLRLLVSDALAQQLGTMAMFAVPGRAAPPIAPPPPPPPPKVEKK